MKCDRTSEVAMGEVVSISGRVTTDTSGQMRSKLGNALRQNPDTVIIDLSHVNYMDTSGLATLIAAMRIARKQDTQLVLRGVQEQPRYLLKVTNLDRMFPIEEEAKP
jgi:anti-sigma B factor antagonist